MKRLFLILLVCFLCGCIKIELQMPQNSSEPVVAVDATDALTEAPTEAPTEEPAVDVPLTQEPTAEPTAALTETPYHPDFEALPKQFNAWKNMEVGETEAKMFSFDWDFDGEEETFLVSLDWEEDTTAITDGKRSITLDFSAALSDVILIDLDPSTPYVNLVVCIDEASDDYVTVSLHPEGDRIVSSEQKYVCCSLDTENGGIIGYEGCDLLGTDTGERYYEGEDLTPTSEWLECWTPDQKELTEERDHLIEGGVLVHAVRDVPCVIDGDPDVIPAGSYVYRVRFCDSRDSIEVCLEDGRIAEIVFDGTEDEEGEGLCWPYTIDGIDQEQYFDNLFFAD